MVNGMVKVIACSKKVVFNRHLFVHRRTEEFK